MPDRYDHIFIGSSPHHLLNAMALEAQGKRVLVIEEKDQVGGAWSTVTLDELGEVEIGCHIWDYSPAVYDFFEEFLEMKLETLSPHPNILYGKKRYRYERKNNILYFTSKLRNIKRGEISAAMKLRDKKYPFTFKQYTYKYPKGGAREFIEKLQNKVNATSLHLQQRCICTGLVVNPEHIEVKTENGSYTCDEVQIASFSPVPISINGEETVPETSAFQFTHVHMLVEGIDTLDLSYTRLYRDPIIHRISDVSSQLELSGGHLILAGIYPSSFDHHTEKEICEYVLERMKSLRLLVGNPVLKRFWFNTYHGTLLQGAAAESVRKLHPNIHHQRTINFTLDLEEQIPYLRKHLMR